MAIKEPWNKYLAEFFGTGILLMLELSIVIFMFGEGSPAAQAIPSVKIRQMMTGFLFGCIGASIALSSIGRLSGAHTNPARTIGPAVVSGQWSGWWIYWVGPLIGTLIASIVFSAVAKRITEAKLYHFDSDQDRLLRKKTSGSPEN